MPITLLIHVIVLVGAIPVSIALGVVFRIRKLTRAQFARRLGVAFGSIVFVALVPLSLFMCWCGIGNNPNFQVTIPALAAGICCAAVGPTRIRWLSVAGFLGLGVVLSAHFHALALPRDRRACQFTGDPAYIENSCVQPKVADRAWHTTITGLYPVRDAK